MISGLRGHLMAVAVFVLTGSVVSQLHAAGADTPSPLLGLLRKNYDPSRSIATLSALTI
jgi:hypothetical protein